MNLEACTLSPTGTIEDAMRSLERSGAEIALVASAEGVVLGTVTDGDVRRALLAGSGLQTPIAQCMHRGFASVGPDAGRAEVIDLMQARRLSGVPVVDDQGRLVGLHLLHEILGSEARPNEAVIMAGGFGARLWPLTETTPKPMLKVAGRPILERLVLHLVSVGIQRIHLAIHHLGNVIEEHFADGSRFGCRISYLREQTPLGTAGALSLLPVLPEHPIVVMNGDLVTEADIGRMLDFHVGQAAATTLAARSHFETIPFGCIELDGVRVRQIEEKPRIAKLVNAGIYVVEPRVLPRIPSGREFAMTDLIADLLSRNEPVCAFELEGEWIDIGQKETLRRARGGSPSE